MEGPEEGILTKQKYQDKGFSVTGLYNFMMQFIIAPGVFLESVTELECSCDLFLILMR